ncbi:MULTISPECIES: ABC transporter ATP-binding protein [unclassified Thermosynechococcus]|uniref:ABC transporter ATP-binding protein n=1 Tax=unclassified Thermosynechococcus TaxID=2622553 RepID=UPI0026735D3C|nr:MULTISPECIES: ABC transporter ATP-binding protein [unclassified Thermosynechococcus]WKT81504.1 ABC transporter ATP-binding protein [Thermosynechococcus sp. PP45]WNC22560.1 ABC transporter ATP-binding protein [Thermosynechococcus sp. PP22]WNC25116.1 ABC transporter ATP-binding protein [Thermosynechococcus sp. PP551]WNC27694.1 ABC transporter ATP-binding protein [Thermosynechococcus sp. PP555]WNC32799.1 ABC transporter ATP-binding protein [Thermosynechococcus sp. PKX95]
MATFRSILGYYRAYRGMAIASMTAASLCELVDLLVPYAIGQILNLLSQQPLDPPVVAIAHTLQTWTGWNNAFGVNLTVLGSIVFLATVVRAPIQPWLGVWFHWWIALAARRDHTRKAVEKILTLPLEFFEENNPGRIANRVSKGISNHTWSYPEIAGQLIPKLVRVLGIGVIVWWLDWPIALGLLTSFTVILVLTLRTLRRIIQKEEILDSHIESTESRTSEIITNIKTVKAFATEARELARQQQRLDREFKMVIDRIHRGYMHLITWQGTVVQFCLFSLLGFSLAATIAGRVSIGHFITIYTLASMAYAEITPLSQVSEVFARRYASILRFHEFMELPPGRDAIDLEQQEIPSLKFSGKVDFQHVWFSYTPGRPILRDINLLIEPCQTVALVGRSGSGKSTLIKLLFRYFQPDQGQILIDGQDIQTLDVRAYRRRLAIVHQEVDVFNGTLWDNLTYANPEVSADAVYEACAIARVDEFVQQLPLGYRTIVGERGLRLSGGQRQRLGIARALLADPDVLIFDEATSSLDYESEREIQLALRSITGTRTMIVIAHRLSTVRDANQIVVLDQGTIREQGDHETLLAQGGLYAHLYSIQRDRAPHA